MKFSRLVGSLLTVIVTTCLPLTPAAAQEIVIGQVLPLSGVLGGTGKELALGVKVYIDALNDKGGLHGKKVVHVVKDDGYVSENTVRLTREVLDRDQALALVGFVGTGNVGELVRQKVLANARVALVAPYTGAESLRQDGNIFHIRAGYADEIQAIAKQISKLGFTTVGVLYQDDAFGQAGLEAAERAIAQNGAKLVVKASYPKNTIKVEAAVKAIAAAEPQAVILVSVSKSSAAFTKQFRQAGQFATLFNVSVVNSLDMTNEVGEVMSGMGVTQVMPFPFVDQSPVVREFRTALKKYGPLDTELSYAALEGFIGAKVLAEGIRRAGPGASREKVIKALETLSNYDVGGFKLSFSPSNHVGSRFVEITMVDRSGRVVR